MNFNYLSTKAELKFFDHLVVPILENTGKWDKSEMEKVHLSFVKNIIGVNRSTTNVLVRGELVRYFLQDKCLSRNINYINCLNEKSHTYFTKYHT